MTISILELQHQYMSRTKAVSLYVFLDDYCVLLFNDEWYAIAKRVAAVIMHDTTAPIQSEPDTLCAYLSRAYQPASK